MVINEAVIITNSKNFIIEIEDLINCDSGINSAQKAF